MLTNKAPYDIKEREHPSEHRVHYIARISREYYWPWEQHTYLERRISTCIRQGYISRNPFQNERVQILNEGFNAQVDKTEMYPIVKYSPHVPGFTILGVSGVGKSTAVESILNLYPQVIKHTEYKGKKFNQEQLVWLKTDCSYDGGLKGLCYNFLAAVDKALGTTYYADYRLARISETSLLVLMQRIAASYFLGILVIDEIQHLNAAGRNATKMLNFFVTLVNTIGVPVIMVGTPLALPILQREFRQARRSSGQGDLTWSVMQNKDIAWNSFVQKMWMYQWTRIPVPLTEEMNNVLYNESQGVTVVAVVVYEIAQLEAIRNEKETFTPKDMSNWARARLSFIQPMLNALRSKKPGLIDKFSDIAISVIEEHAIPEIAEELKRKSSAKVSIIDLVTEHLKGLGVLPEKARYYAEIAARKRGRSTGEDFTPILHDAFTMHMREIHELENLSYDKELDEDDLRKGIIK